MSTIRTRLTVTAGVAIIALTAAAFWLSYAHLHDVAAAHGLGDSPARAWAWPATLDLFIVAGEIMMLVSALDKRKDVWAIGLTVAGSIGSIGLNVYGVGPDAPLIEYIVAAVPPAAALLAFGALMRQIHAAIAEPDEEFAPEVTLEKAQDEPGEPAAHVLVQEFPAELEGPDTAVEVHRNTARPSVADIASAVEDLQREGAELTGKALASYFGVSDRSGRRYLKDWAADYQSA